LPGQGRQPVEPDRRGRNQQPLEVRDRRRLFRRGKGGTEGIEVEAVAGLVLEQVHAVLREEVLEPLPHPG
jgi:hypothetical protein